ncbi:MAG: flagellar FliJ family protein [Actinomycetota bacterium]
MARFRFTLEPVLEHRSRQEELAQQELAAAIAAVAAQQEAAVEAQRAADTEIAELRALQTGPVTLHELRAKHEAVDRARRIAHHEAEGVTALETVAVERRGQLIQASQAVQALAKLKERHRGTHLAAIDRRDAAEIDELALRAYRAGGTAGGAAA